jgi:4-amino-4-deoxy-L-arabinose transferase-like glycosyltransferase
VSIPIGLATLVQRQRLSIIAVVLVAIAVLRVAGTYGVYNATWDEPAHLACGMELLQLGQYTYEPQHPPLARVSVALGPYLAGVRGFTPRLGSMWSEGLDMLYREGSYFRTLGLARLGIIPFFLLGAVLLWLWTRRQFDRFTALLALLLYTLSPNILAHAGLATTDMAAAAMQCAAVLAFAAWLEVPTLRRGVLMGLAVGLALVTKFSTVVFLPACVVAVVVLRWVVERRGWRRVLSVGPAASRAAGVALLVAFLASWAMYGFSLGPLIGPPNEGLVERLAALPVYPLSEVVQGVRAVAEHNAEGHPSYLLGEVRDFGWWYYFPVAFLVKTPIAFLILAGIGGTLLVRRVRTERRWQSAVPLACAGAIMLVSLTSNINIGVRHILVVYPLLAIVAAFGAASLLRARRVALRMGVIGLLAWNVGASVAAHPDYLPYFNALAGDTPERILIAADLDWGQDLQRLGTVVRRRGIRELAITYFGSAVPPHHVHARLQPLEPYESTTGWVAASAWRLWVDDSDAPPYDGFAWLRAHQPTMRVGRSIFLYHLPDTLAVQQDSIAESP